MNPRDECCGDADCYNRSSGVPCVHDVHGLNWPFVDDIRKRFKIPHDPSGFDGTNHTSDVDELLGHIDAMEHLLSRNAEIYGELKSLVSEIQRDEATSKHCADWAVMDGAIDVLSRYEPVLVRARKSALWPNPASVSRMSPTCAWLSDGTKIVLNRTMDQAWMEIVPILKVSAI